MKQIALKKTYIEQVVPNEVQIEWMMIPKKA